MATVCVARRGLTEWPADTFSDVEAGCLEAYQNNFTDLPTEVGQLKKLTRIILWNNKLASLPDEIGNLKALQVNVICLALQNRKLTFNPTSSHVCPPLSVN
jgi:hypothetical protein